MFEAIQFSSLVFYTDEQFMKKTGNKIIKYKNLIGQFLYALTNDKAPPPGKAPRQRFLSPFSSGRYLSSCYKC